MNENQEIISHDGHNGQWPKGTSGNPAGRPRGSRNKSTLAMESLLEGASEQLINKALEMAFSGDILAMRLCLERILPVRRERLIELDLPPIQTPNQISISLEKIFSAIGEGQITPAEGETLSNILTHKLKALHAEDVESRLAKLEAMAASDAAEYFQQ